MIRILQGSTVTQTVWGGLTTTTTTKDRTLHNRWQLHQMLTDFHNFCTVGKRTEFSTKPHHLESYTSGCSGLGCVEEKNPCGWPLSSVGGIQNIYRVGQKSKPDNFCNNFVYCQPISIIFGTYTLEEICNQKIYS